MLSDFKEFTKENLDFYLKELAKQYRKMYHPSIPAEVVLVGGAAILSGYTFRASTQDVDALGVDGPIRDAARAVADKYGLPADWLNSDFTRTSSYSPKLRQYSKPYRKYSQAIEFRVIGAEYLIAMKLVSAREYKHDISDIIGILREQKQFGNAITEMDVAKALKEMYGGLEVVADETWGLFRNLVKEYQKENVYEQISENEQLAKVKLMDFEEKYPGVLNDENVKDILHNMSNKPDDSAEG